MTITLKPEHERLVNLAMQRGNYENPDEVIGRALEMLNSEDQWLSDHRDEVAQKIERAFEQFERGEFFSAEQSRVDMQRRKVEWLANRKR